MICQRIQYCFAHEVSDVFPGGIVLLPGCSLRELTGTIDYNSSGKNADTGNTLTETARVRARETDPLLLTVKDPRLILKLFAGDGKIIVMGSPRYPARVTISENPPEITLNFSVTSA
ncbi:MAG: hypothetical protein LBP56_00250 [Odoribacteraceae bacterium]|jgi:hypothetical protein|nr:hypothetical protein [Odoribacteraceae bacterium]